MCFQYYITLIVSNGCAHIVKVVAPITPSNSGFQADSILSLIKFATPLNMTNLLVL